jgi:hypothetical protein
LVRKTTKTTKVPTKCAKKKADLVGTFAKKRYFCSFIAKTEAESMIIGREEERRLLLS